MSDPTKPEEPITGHDQTNGLAEGLEGDDGGAVDPSPDENVISEAIRDLDDPLTDEESAETPYSEEGKP
ncbi:hypothetical protein ACFVWR_08320 [Leifsonia sp. NPDC058292]|uniref:hypothetical protein n=1 Tax=Leifsonia sp. NPDC058292 TaxID=3346428 RepID=UPI0036DC0683